MSLVSEYARESSLKIEDTRMRLWFLQLAEENIKLIHECAMLEDSLLDKFAVAIAASDRGKIKDIYVKAGIAMEAREEYYNEDKD